MSKNQDKYHEFRAKGLPDGYNTILGYMTANNPEAFDLIECPSEFIQDDEPILTERALALNSTVIVQAPCEWMRERGELFEFAFEDHILMALL